MDDLVEIIRQPILVFRQRTEALLRSLKFADFARNIGVFENSADSAAFARNCFAVNMGRSCRAERISARRSVVSVCRMLSVYIWGRLG